MKTAEEKADDGYQYLLEQGTLNDLSAQKQIEIQEALRITSGKYAKQPAVSDECPTCDGLGSWSDVSRVHITCSMCHGSGKSLNNEETCLKEMSSLLSKKLDKDGELSEIFANHADHTPYLNFDAFKEAIKELRSQPAVSDVCVNCDETKEVHSICGDCLNKIIEANKNQPAVSEVELYTEHQVKNLVMDYAAFIIQCMDGEAESSPVGVWVGREIKKLQSLNVQGEEQKCSAPLQDLINAVDKLDKHISKSPPQEKGGEG